MTSYLVRRLSIMPVSLLGLTLLVFGLLQTLDPAARAAAYVRNTPKTTDEMQRVIEKYGLDQPIYVQYFRWLGEVAQGNLGYSVTAGEPVADAIRSRFPATVELALYTFLLVATSGIWLGMKAAAHHNRLPDQALRIVSLLALSFPGFVFAMLLILFFYVVLKWFPLGRLSHWADVVVFAPGFHRYTGLNTLDGMLNGRVDVFLDALRHLVLPVLTLAYSGWAIVMRVMRSSMLDALHQDYITAARARGLREQKIIGSHARPNALIPTVTLASLIFAGLLSGVALVETVFQYEGIGRWTVKAATNLDAVAVLGITLLNAIVLILINLAVDVAYVLLDPRIRATTVRQT
jgi:peptide/nickel transport system permease protein